MKKSLTLLAVCLFSLMSFAQSNQLVWNNGRMQYAAPIANIDSITFPGNVLASDTLHFILPRSQEKYIYDTITVEKHDTVYRTVTVVQKDTIYLPVYVDLTKEYALAGAFSVAADRQVCFSRGNLQYSIAMNKWSFAKNQYDMIGTANINGNNLSYYMIDLFGCSADNPATLWGVSTSTDDPDYTGNFVDWGWIIGDGTTWRTLTMYEWDYLCHARTNFAQLYSLAIVNETRGLILLPDAWTLPSGARFVARGRFESNVYTIDEWAVMESAGAVFLPAAGFRNGTSMSRPQWYGHYHSSTTEEFVVSHLIFSEGDQLSMYHFPRSMGSSVRLVQDL